jgi:predicted SnoaL-like aldol condensation-catalyzing enzyme
VPDFPARAERVDAIDRQTRKLIEDAERAAAMHQPDLTEFACRILAGRKQRDRFFAPALFSNPAWDMLLHLYVATAEDGGMDMLDCWMVSSTPKGVALRWLDYFRQEEMVVEIADRKRMDQTLIRLSDATQMAISAYLGSLIALGLREEPLLPNEPPGID